MPWIAAILPVCVASLMPLLAIFSCFHLPLLSEGEQVLPSIATPKKNTKTSKQTKTLQDNMKVIKDSISFVWMGVFAEKNLDNVPGQQRHGASTTAEAVYVSGLFRTCWLTRKWE